jgi:hypothetical protein
MPGTRIADEDRKKIDMKFICTICNLLLCMPMQTQCGHLMCFSCLQILLEYVDFLYCYALIEIIIVLRPLFTSKSLQRLYRSFPNANKLNNSMEYYKNIIN